MPQVIERPGPILSLDGDRAQVEPHERIIGPLGQLFTQELDRLGVALDDVVSVRTFYMAAALVRQGVGVTVVDSSTALACLVPGLSMRPLKPRIAFDIHAMFLINRPPGALADDFLKTLKQVLDTP